MLVYRYGAFETPPGINTAIHVSPACVNILKNDGIVPRYLREDKSEGLGGQHDVSVSAYSNPEAALNTLYYMWRIWQVYHRELGLKEILDLDPTLDPERVEFLFNNRYTPSEIIGACCISERCKNPIVYSSKWAENITTDDICAIEFLIEETQLFTGHTRSKIREENNLPFHKIKGFNKAASEYIRNSRFIDGYGVIDFYSKIKQAILQGELSFDPYLQEYGFSSQQRSYEDRMEDARHSFFGMDKWRVLSDPYLMKHAVEFYNHKTSNSSVIFPVGFQFENFYLDFKPREFAIEECYEYYINEAEFRFFKTIKSDRFVRIYTIEDALSFALERNNGVEPLFFPMKPFEIDFNANVVI